MPSERRQIRFTTREVSEALRRFAEDHERSLPDQSVTSIDYDTHSEEGVTARVHFGDAQRPTHFTPLELAAALIAHCRKVRVPIPRQGRKSLHESNGNLVLQIDLKPR
jgi:hypothetical protein